MPIDRADPGSQGSEGEKRRPDAEARHEPCPEGHHPCRRLGASTLTAWGPVCEQSLADQERVTLRVTLLGRKVTLRPGAGVTLIGRKVTTSRIVMTVGSAGYSPFGWMKVTFGVTSIWIMTST